VVGYWWLVPLIGIGSALAWWRMPDGPKTVLWELFYRVPIFGPPLKNVLLSNAFDNLALMLDSGVSLTVSLRIVSDAVTSRALKVRLQNILANIEKGGRMSDGFRDPFFPSMAAGVLAQGEMVGSIDAYFRRLSGFLRDRAQARLMALSTLIEPIMLLIGGSMLMLLAVGIFLPIYGAMKNVGH
jgi:type II secretory pathway component PulF